MLIPTWLKVAIAFAVFCISHAATSGSSNGEDNTQKEVVQMITTSYNNDIAKAILLLYYLDHSKDNNDKFDILRALLNKPKSFKSYCETLLEAIPAEIKEKVALNLLTIKQNMDAEGIKVKDIGLESGRSYVSLLGVIFGPGGLWHYVPKDCQEKIISHCYKWATSFSAKIPSIVPKLWSQLPKGFGIVDEALGLLGITPTKLSVAQLPYDLLVNTYQWYTGGISGKRFTKNMIDSTGITAGMYYGAKVGRQFCPYPYIGELIGGAMGGIVSSYSMDTVTSRIFDLPKDVAVENAYNFFNVHHRASNAAVNYAYKKLYDQYNSVNGGSQEKFDELQTYMTIIKVHRGEVYK